jgi:hypothetical protein
MKLKFKARYSIFTVCITIAVNLLVTGILVFLLQHNLPFRGINSDWLLVIFLFGLLVFVFMVHPTGYTITDSNIVINRLLWSTTIPVTTKSEIKSIQKSDLGLLFRSFGSGGFWGLLGYFQTSNYGRVFMNVTDSKNILLIATNGKNYIISPENAKQFLTITNNFSNP